jgi:hypothetical protein
MTNANSMSFMKRKTTFAVVSFILSCTTVSLTAADTPESRRDEAERYLQAVPPKALFEDMAEKMSTNMPPDQRAQSRHDFTTRRPRYHQGDDGCDGETFLERGIKSTGGFLWISVGKSAMQKFGAYMSDLMPTIQAEMMKAEAKASQSLPNTSPH